MPELKKPKSSEMCPPGYHVVRGHERVCQSGTVTWVDAHIRKNRGKIKSGLMQVTDQMVRVLGGFPNKKGYIEARKNLIHIKYEDKLDPNVNTALGIRLLGHKYSQIPKGNPKDARNTLKMYHQWNKHGEKYADEVLSRCGKARDKK